MIWVWLKELSMWWKFMKIKFICPHMDKNEYGNRICLINPIPHGYVHKHEWCDKFNCPRMRETK